MTTIEKLDNAFIAALSIVNFKGGFDTFKFRKGFEYDFDLSTKEQKEILGYLIAKIQKGGRIYQTVKSQIDYQEFLSTDYYSNPYPRNFRGAYSPVVLKTFGGVMALSL